MPKIILFFHIWKFIHPVASMPPFKRYDNIMSACSLVIQIRLPSVSFVPAAQLPNWCPHCIIKKSLFWSRTPALRWAETKFCPKKMNTNQATCIFFFLFPFYVFVQILIPSAGRRDLFVIVAASNLLACANGHESNGTLESIAFASLNSPWLMAHRSLSFSSSSTHPFHIGWQKKLMSCNWISSFSTLVFVYALKKRNCRQTPPGLVGIMMAGVWRGSQLVARTILRIEYNINLNLPIIILWTIPSTYQKGSYHRY